MKFLADSLYTFDRHWIRNVLPHPQEKRKCCSTHYSPWADRFRARKRIRVDEQCHIRGGNWGQTWAQSGETKQFYRQGALETPNYEAHSDASTGLEQRIPEANDYDADTFDRYFGAETFLPQGDSMLWVVVKTRKKRDANSNRLARLTPTPYLTPASTRWNS